MEKQSSELEQRRLQLELDIKTAELRLKELELKSVEEHKKWLINLSASQAAVLVAVIGILGSFLGAYIQGWNAQELKRLEFESNLILKAVETGDVEESKRNIQFLLAAGFVQDERGIINRLLESGKYTIKLPSKTSETILRSAEANDLEGVVQEILKQSGLPQNFVLQPDPGVGNAAAVVLNGEKILLYDPLWILELKKSTGTNWAIVFVLSHEIAHHLIGHTLQSGIQSDHKQQELEADEFAGFVLGRLGASLDEAQRIVSVMPNPEESSTTHPPNEYRLRAIEKGWQHAQESEKK